MNLYPPSCRINSPGDKSSVKGESKHTHDVAISVRDEKKNKACTRFENLIGN